MTYNPIISIIIYIYNNENIIEKCISSINNQDLANIEIILIDDGSTDNSGKICDIYSQQYLNLFTIHQSHQGLGFAFNAGLKIARGQYISFLNPKTNIESLSYFELYKQAINNNADIAIAKIKICGDNIKNKFIESIFVEKIKEKKLLNWKDIGANKIFSKNNLIFLSNKIFKKDFLESENITFLTNKNFGHISFYFHAIFTAKKIFYSRNNEVKYYSSKEKIYKKDINILYYFEIIKEIKIKLSNKISIQAMSLFYNFVIYQIITYYFVVPEELTKKYLYFAKIYLPFYYYIKMYLLLHLAIIKNNFSLFPIKKIITSKTISFVIFNLFPIISIKKIEHLDYEYDCIIIIGNKNKFNLKINKILKKSIYYFDNLSLRIINDNLKHIKLLTKNDVIKLKPDDRSVYHIKDNISFLSGALSISKNLLIIDLDISHDLNLIYDIYYNLNSMFYDKKIDLMVNTNLNPTIPHKFVLSNYIKLYKIDKTNIETLIQKQKIYQLHKTVILSILKIPFLIIRKKI